MKEFPMKKIMIVSGVVVTALMVNVLWQAAQHARMAARESQDR